MAKYFPEIGDVIINNGEKCVVVDVKIYEDYDSLCYNRVYKLCSLNIIDSIGWMLEDTLKKYCHSILVNSGTFPTIEKCEDEAPFKFIKETRVYIERKKPKTIVVYE
jgi:hypothetical protein